MTHENELIELLDKETPVGDLQDQRESIERTFREFGLQGKITRAYCGLQVNCYDFEIGAEEKQQSYCAIEKNLQMALGKTNVRMIMPRNEDGTECRLEVPTKCRMIVSAETLFGSKEWCDSKAKLPLMLGKGIDGKIEIMDLALAPHLLIGGCTGSGKSVLMDSCIHSLMFKYTPCELKLILVDFKVVEFSKYEKLPYLQFPVINSTKDTLRALQWLNMEMERRYEVIGDAGCRDIRTLNEQRPCSLPYIVMIIDEFSDYMAEAKTQMESLLAHLCAKGRAAGIHLIISTQRPDLRVLTGSIRANFPVRIAFRVAAHTDSKRILDVGDAADLLGLGDMLFRGPGSEELTRIQGVYVNDMESARIIDHLKSMYGDMKPNALPPMRGTERNQIDVLHGKLVDIIRNVLENNLDNLKDDAIDDACEEIADSIIEHWDELKEVDCDVEEVDSESDEGLPEMERELLLKAIQVVVESRRPVISVIQRQLEIGYNTACALLETMEQYGIVSPQPNNGPRSILVDTCEEAISRLPKQK